MLVVGHEIYNKIRLIKKKRKKLSKISPNPSEILFRLQSDSTDTRAIWWPEFSIERILEFFIFWYSGLYDDT